MSVRSFRHTSSERAQPLNQPRGARANGSSVRTRRQAQSSVLADAQRGDSHFYTRSSWHSGAGARDDPKEEQRSLCRRLSQRPGRTARLLLQLDDLDGHILLSGRRRAPRRLRRSVGAGEDGRPDSRSRHATSHRECAPVDGPAPRSRSSCRAGVRSRCAQLAERRGRADRTIDTRARRLGPATIAHTGARCASPGRVAVARRSCTRAAPDRGNW